MTTSADAIDQTYTLADRYTREKRRVFLSGVQALVRLPLMQRQRDQEAGLDTAGFISGYRGSPIGGYDRALWQAADLLKQNHIHFEPGLNEDLAATAVWGSQQVNAYAGAKYDGVFSIWYGKGPGVDRCGDVITHANASGTSRHGGVLFVAGDDHGGISSTLPHQSDHNFVAAMMPVLAPSNIQDLLDMGILGWALSRYSGCWVGFKLVSEILESSASVDAGHDRVSIKLPDDFQIPDGGLNFRRDIDRFAQEAQLQTHKGYAALAFARANRIDKVVLDAANPRFGIMTSGKAYMDVRQALDDLGIDDQMAAEIGLRLYKVGMVWPLEKDGARAFAQGLDEVLVVEEKRAILENQLKEQLYNWKPSVRPRVVGKFDEHGEWLLPSRGELTPAQIARVIAARLGQYVTSDSIRERLEFLERKEAALERTPAKIDRIPYFCSGCPHNTSTRVPEGSRAVAGIGCHFMATWMNRETDATTHMGGEGVPWIGEAPFTDQKHVFANLGDGTYLHSGLLAIRAAISAGVNITYKILYNDAVAMIGGQPLEGSDPETKLTVPMIAQQLTGEGVHKIVIVTDEPDKYGSAANIPKHVDIHHRDRMDDVQRQLRDTPGVTALIYDQTCAAEKRRRRKRGTFPDPQKRLFINDAVCEGCGDCSVVSNCVSVVPVETELGRKRAIDQHSCNKDYSCVNGFCPSFVTVLGGALRKPRSYDIDPAAVSALSQLPNPDPVALDQPVEVLVAGIGGTGVITISALLGMAAHLEGKGCSVLDMTGLAQKNGAVYSHIKVAAKSEHIRATRIAAGQADLLLGCDMVSAAAFQSLAKVDTGHTRAVINQHFTPTAGFVLDNEMDFHEAYTKQQISDAAGANLTEFVDATKLATALLGDSLAANMFMMGYAFQRGQLPVGQMAIERAIELNGIAIDMNTRAFAWGRLAAHDLALVQNAAAPLLTAPETEPRTETLDEVIEHRSRELSRYQDQAYAQRYRDLVERVRAAEQEKVPGHEELAAATARCAFKVMAYKDEYEVARLYSDPKFRTKLAAQFDGGFKLRLNFAPPLLARRNPATGRPTKMEFGPWLFPGLKVLAKFIFLRGSPFDPFGYTADRRAERQAIAAYEATLNSLCTGLTPNNHRVAVEIALIPDQIRGFGFVKENNRAGAAARQTQLEAAFRDPDRTPKAAE